MRSAGSLKPFLFLAIDGLQCLSASLQKTVYRSIQCRDLSGLKIFLSLCCYHSQKQTSRAHLHMTRFPKVHMSSNGFSVAIAGSPSLTMESHTTPRTFGKSLKLLRAEAWGWGRNCCIGFADETDHSSLEPA